MNATNGYDDIFYTVTAFYILDKFLRQNRIIQEIMHTKYIK